MDRTARRRLPSVLRGGREGEPAAERCHDEPREHGDGGGCKNGGMLEGVGSLVDVTGSTGVAAGPLLRPARASDVSSSTPPCHLHRAGVAGGGEDCREHVRPGARGRRDLHEGWLYTPPVVFSPIIFFMDDVNKFYKFEIIIFVKINKIMYNFKNYQFF